VVAHSSDEVYYRSFAHDALAYLAAMRGDAVGFDEQAECCDALGWEGGPLQPKAEILYYRGLSCRALQRYEAAERWLERSIAFAEEHGFNRVLFLAEEALANLTEYIEDRASPAPAAPPDVREGVRAMRQELVAAGA
jgi:tetratricopeptide (TPR) repeat protein